MCPAYKANVAEGVNGKVECIGGVSSVGRTLDLHSRGGGFESRTLQKSRPLVVLPEAFIIGK